MQPNRPGVPHRWSHRQRTQPAFPAVPLSPAACRPPFAPTDCSRYTVAAIAATGCLSEPSRESPPLRAKPGTAQADARAKATGCSACFDGLQCPLQPFASPLATACGCPHHRLAAASVARHSLATTAAMRGSLSFAPAPSTAQPLSSLPLPCARHTVAASVRAVSCRQGIASRPPLSPLATFDIPLSFCPIHPIALAKH